jgi:hypothetical protein
MIAPPVHQTHAVARNRCSPPALDCTTVLPDAGSPRFHIPDLVKESEVVADVAIEPNDNHSVVLFTCAAEMLAEANTVQKAKELMSLALTAADWARRKNLGKEAELHCRKYALEAERKLGQLLKTTVRAKGGQPHQKSYKSTGNTTSPVEPTLANLGISKRESSRAQALAKLSEKEFAALLNGARIKRPAKRKRSAFGYRVVELPVKDITFSEDLRNFKRNADLKTGVVPGERLSGEYVRLGTAPIVVWLRLDGRKVIITGRHRLDLAIRMGEYTIPAHIVREEDGFTLADALKFDAESNIRDGHGAVEDYAHYFKNSPSLTEADAKDQGLFCRAKGRDGWSLGKMTCENVYALWQAGKIDERQAVAIATTAPGEVALQSFGVRIALEGEKPEVVAESMRAKAADAVSRNCPKAAQSDFFADTGLDEQYKAEGRFVSKAKATLQDQIIGRKAILRKFDQTTNTGSVTAERTWLEQELSKFEFDLRRWNDWRSHPDLKAKFKGEITNQPDDGKVALAA